MSTELRQLSEREREILRLVASGLSNQQIANHLGVSVNTIKVHLRNVFSKVGAASRTEATMYAVRTGIVTVEPASAAASPKEYVAVEPDQGLLPEAPVDVAADPVSIKEPPDGKADPDADETTPTSPATPAATRPAFAVPPIGLKYGFLGAVVLLSLAVGGAWRLGWIGQTRGSAATAQEANAEDQKRWKVLPTIGAPRAAFAIANVGDLIFIIGGENQTGILDSVERYDPRFETWTELSKKPTPVTDIRATVIGGKVYVPGGRLSSDSKTISRAFERYDPRTEVWETLPDLPQPRSAYALAAVEGKLYIFGGWDGISYRTEVFEYDPDQETWSERAPMPTARAFSDAGVVEDSIFVLGGENETGPLATNEVYRPAEEGRVPWTRRAPMPEARSRFGLAVALSTVHVIGGEPHDAAPQKYNVRTDSWQIFSTPPQSIGSQPGVTLLDVMIVSVGGKVNADSYSEAMQGYQALFLVTLPRQ